MNAAEIGAFGAAIIQTVKLKQLEALYELLQGLAEVDVLGDVKPQFTEPLTDGQAAAVTAAAGRMGGEHLPVNFAVGRSRLIELTHPPALSGAWHATGKKSGGRVTWCCW